MISVINSSIEIQNCVFGKNENTTLSLKAAKAWFTGESMFNVNFALEGSAISDDQNSLIPVFRYGIITFTLEVTWHIIEVPFILGNILQHVRITPMTVCDLFPVYTIFST